MIVADRRGWRRLQKFARALARAPAATRKYLVKAKHNVRCEVDPLPRMETIASTHVRHEGMESSPSGLFRPFVAHRRRIAPVKVSSEGCARRRSRSARPRTNEEPTMSQSFTTSVSPSRSAPTATPSRRPRTSMAHDLRTPGFERCEQLARQHRGQSELAWKNILLILAKARWLWPTSSR